MDPAAVGGADGVGFCCPSCRGPLAFDQAGYHCRACQRRYPIVCGIPDFRLFPDPYISFEDEYDKARRLSEEAERVSFEALVRFYWEITPDVPRPMAERFIRYAVTGEERADPCLATMDAQAGGRWTGARCLEVGCGTGGFLAAAQERFGALVGADIALRWLVVAKKRPQGIASLSCVAPPRRCRFRTEHSTRWSGFMCWSMRPTRRQSCPRPSAPSRRTAGATFPRRTGSASGPSPACGSGESASSRGPSRVDT